MLNKTNNFAAKARAAERERGGVFSPRPLVQKGPQSALQDCLTENINASCTSAG
jgi:hypothetical protein